VNSHRGIDKATHALIIQRPSMKSELITLFHADCGAPDWKIWGVDAPNVLRPSTDVKITIARPDTIVDALVHCIDRASRREPVHEPDTMAKLRGDIVRYEGLQTERCLTEKHMLNWKFTLEELKGREELIRTFRVVEGGDEGEKVQEMLDRGVIVLSTKAASL
jgi:hypothetical protein